VGLIYVDACLLIYAFEDHPRHGARVRRRLAAAPPDTLAISPLVQLECLVGPMKTGNLVLQRYYEEGLRQLVSLPLPETVFLQAARARAQFGLKTPDAIHLAAAQHHRCAALWTNDDRLAQAAHGLAVNVLVRV
jgi:predicted nucleic acid-binding protein